MCQAPAQALVSTRSPGRPSGSHIWGERSSIDTWTAGLGGPGQALPVPSGSHGLFLERTLARGPQLFHSEEHEVLRLMTCPLPPKHLPELRPSPAALENGVAVPLCLPSRPHGKFFPSQLCRWSVRWGSPDFVLRLPAGCGLSCEAGKPGPESARSCPAMWPPAAPLGPELASSD